MRESGFNTWLFWTFAAFDDRLPTTKHMRGYEFTSFLLLRPTTNTVDQQGDRSAKKIII